MRTAILILLGAYCALFIVSCAHQTKFAEMAYIHAGSTFCTLYDERVQVPGQVEPFTLTYETTRLGCPNDEKRDKLVADWLKFTAEETKEGGTNE